MYFCNSSLSAKSMVLWQEFEFLLLEPCVVNFKLFLIYIEMRLALLSCFLFGNLIGLSVTDVCFLFGLIILLDLFFLRIVLFFCSGESPILMDGTESWFSESTSSRLILILLLRPLFEVVTNFWESLSFEIPLFIFLAFGETECFIWLIRLMLLSFFEMRLFWVVPVGRFKVFWFVRVKLPVCSS